MSQDSTPSPSQGARAASRKERSRTRILESAARLFRRHGYNGVGLMAIMNDAGLTPGAFYAHFQSKEHLFAEVVGMQSEFSARLVDVNEIFPKNPDRALGAALDYYLGDCNTDNVFAACTLASLAADIGRANVEVRARFEHEMLKLFEEFSADLPEADKQQRLDQAIVTLALCSGGVALAKAMADEEVSARILRVCREATLKFTGSTVPSAAEFPPGTAPPNAK